MPTLQGLESKAAHHWKERLPAMTAELKSTGEWEQRLRSAAMAAQQEMRELQGQGYKEHEAEEVVLPKLILLKPEPGVEPDWEQDELEEMEARYLKMMKEFQAGDEDE